MSIKTSKRIALGVIASLVFAPFAAIAPASAAASVATMTRGTVTPSVPTVGVPVTIPVLIAMGALGDTGGTSTFTATFGQRPVNTTLAADSITAGITTRAAAFATASTTTTSTAAADNVLTLTIGASFTGAQAAAAAGEFTFTPDTPGLYSISIAKGTANDDVTDVTAIVINVTGAALTQASSGKGVATGNAVVNGSAVVAYTLRATTAAATRFNITSSGVGSILNGIGCADQSAVLVSGATAVRCSGTAVGTIATINGTNYVDGFSYTSGALITNGALTAASKSEQFTFDAASSVVGTQTITITEVALATGIPTTRATITINWVASASANASPQYSTAWINAGTTLATAANDDTVDGVSCSRVADTQCANIVVTVRDANNVALNGSALSATITGPGVLGQIAVDGTTTTGAASARSVATAAATPLTNNVGVIAVWPDGTSGTATITISSGTVVLATKTVVFYGTVATLEATQNLKVARASAAGAQLGCSDADCTWVAGTGTRASIASNTPAVYIVAKDAAGEIVPGLTITMVSNDTSVIVSGAINEDDATAGDGPGYYNASVTSAPNGTSGASGTVVFRTQLASGAFITTDPITFTLGGTLASMTLSLDKATYGLGEQMVVTRTGTDSAGNPVFDGVASPAVIFNKAIGGTAPGAGEFRSGASSSSATRPTVFAPSTFGEFEARATYVVAATGASVQVSAKASVPAPVVPEVVPPAEKPTLTATLSGGRIFLSGTAADGEGDIIIYVKRVGTTAWKERAKTLEVAAPGDFNGSIKAPKNNVVIRVKQEGTGQFSNQVLVLR